jgi:hypothetical protein
MTARNKKTSLQNLNTLVLSTILKEEDNTKIDELKKQWESPDFQHKLAIEVFGIKSKNLQQGPKRNKSAYMFFCQDMRQKAREEDPTRKLQTAALGKPWRELTAKQKSKYYDMAAEDKERYLDMKAIEKSRNKTPSKLSSYFLFCEDERPLIKKEFPDMLNKEVTAECGKRWNELKLNNSEKYLEYVEKAAN